MSKKLGILLGGNIGDIIICLPIAKYYHDAGYEIFWPVYDNLINHFKDYVEYVNFIPLDTKNFNPIVDSENIFKNLECEVLDLAFTSPGAFQRKNSIDFINQNELHFDEFRYKLASVPFEEKWKLTFTRNKQNEEDLFNNLVQREFCLVHLQGSDCRSNYKIANEKDHQVIEIEPITKSVFDWMKMIEEAKVLVAFDSCVANLIEQTNIKTKKFFIRRTQEKTTPILKNKWIIL